MMNKLPKTENASVEFKASFNENVIETLVAFSNAKGGTVYVGVSDNGNITGVTVGREAVQSWINEIKSKTTPQVIPDAEVLTVEGKNVVALSVPEYPIKPVSIRGKFYKRMGNSNHLLGIDEIANEHLKTINSSWDFYVDPNHAMEDLSKRKIARFTKKIKQNGGIRQVKLSDLEVLNKLESLRNGKITFGAYLLFVKDYCPISDVQVGRFKSDTMIIDSVSLNSDLFQEVEDIMAFIRKHLKVEYIITGQPQRTERFDYPLDAIREVVVNMVVHRDYRDSSASIIKIFDNRMEFYNPGKLYGGITVEDLISGNYTSQSRNKLIARAFKEMGVIERYGSGIMRICQMCKDYGVKAPKFYEVGNGFQVVLFNERIGIPKIKTVEETEEETVEKTVEEIATVEKIIKKTEKKAVEKTVEKIEEETVEETSKVNNAKKDTEKDTVKDTNKNTIKDTVNVIENADRGTVNVPEKVTENTNDIENDIEKVTKNTNVIKNVIEKVTGNTNVIENGIEKVTETTGGIENGIEKVTETTGGIENGIEKVIENVSRGTEKGTVNTDRGTVRDAVNTGRGTVKDTVNTDRGTVKDTVNTDRGTVNEIEKLNDIQKMILQKMRDNEKITVSELAGILKINLRNTKYNIAKMKCLELIERIGPDKGGFWKVKRHG